MKKLTSLLLIACLALGVLGVASVSAANDEVLMGTPTVDGKLDDIYTQSLTVVYDGDANKNSVQGHPWSGDSSTTYVLYDEERVYICAVVVDEDVVGASDAYIAGYNPYENDLMEFHMNLSGNTAPKFKIGIDALGKRAYSYNSDSTSLEAVLEIEYATALTDDGYIVEVSFLHSTDEGKMLLEAGEFGLKIWQFDLQASANGTDKAKYGVDVYHYVVNEGDEAAGDPIYFPLSDKKVETSTTDTNADDTASDDTAADDTASDDTAADDTTSDDTVEVAPTTFDVAIIAAVVAVASGAAVVVSKKRR